MMFASMEKPSIFKSGFQMQNIAVNIGLRGARDQACVVATGDAAVSDTRQARGIQQPDLAYKLSRCGRRETRRSYCDAFRLSRKSRNTLIAAERPAGSRDASMADTSAPTLRPSSAAAVFSSRQKASSSVMEVRCPATVSERFFGNARLGSIKTRTAAWLSFAASRVNAYSPGLIISSGFISALKSSSVTKPSASASSRSVVPCLCAVLAI